MPPLIPDIEAITTAYLDAHPDVSVRIVGTSPSSRTSPWVRVTQLDAPKEPASTPEHLIGYLVQLDCYAGVDGPAGQGPASLLARTVRSALLEMPDSSHDGAAVTAVRVISCPRVPDVDFEPARERYILTVQIFAHA